MEEGEGFVSFFFHVVLYFPAFQFTERLQQPTVGTMVGTMAEFTFSKIEICYTVMCDSSCMHNRVSVSKVFVMRYSQSNIVLAVSKTQFKPVGSLSCDTFGVTCRATEPCWSGKESLHAGLYPNLTVWFLSFFVRSTVLQYQCITTY